MPGQACWGFRQLVCGGPGKEEDYDTNIQLPALKVSIPGGPVDSNIPSWSEDGETCLWQNLPKAAECQLVTSGGQGKIVTSKPAPISCEGTMIGCYDTTFEQVT